MADLLIELFSEEIPARMQARASEDLKRLVTDGLREAGLSFAGAEAESGPRRLVLHIEGLPARSADVREEKKGPRVGAPEAALAGFLKSAGLTSASECETRNDGKGAFYVAVIEKPGQPAADIIARALPEVIRKFPWPKSMRWGAGKLRWVRPLHSILCLLDGKVVPFAVDGVESGAITQGHRRAGAGPIAVTGWADYAEKLKSAGVELRRAERISSIGAQAAKLAAAEKLALVEDQALVEENAGLAERPVVLAGTFDADFLNVPQEVLITAMKAHQKCFSLRSPDKGALANRFLMVANMEAQDGGKAIVAGNERVIRARLSDAKFFWDNDRRRRLDALLPTLDAITFHEKLGTQGERVKRLMRLARELAPHVGADPAKAERAAQLAKADLVSETVGEFPELQGVIGRYIAREQGEILEVANAIADHYKPSGQSDSAPTSPVSIAVALADRLDMLVSFWLINEKPTGSKDPYGLRRSALGVVRTLLEGQLRLSLNTILRGIVNDWIVTWDDQYNSVFAVSEKKRWPSKKIFPNRMMADDVDAFEIRQIQSLDELGDITDFIPNEIWFQEDDARGFQDGFTVDSEISDMGPIDRVFYRPLSVTPDLLSFLADRLKVHLRERGARHDLIDAVFSLGGQDDLLMIVRRVEALGRFLATDDGANLLTGVRRAQNILKIEEKKDKRDYAGSPDAKLLKEPQEKALAKAIDDVTKDARKSLSTEDFEGAMSAIARLRAPVDAFFDKVTVNAPDSALRENRLRLLSQIRAATLEVADFSKIEG